ncbi:MAG: AzlD domain-containing protein [Deltaproteobacteria bacterium]|jgi:branched-subunit amino acid transport protein|nr:AzlD domain-containing protein [Deltaproteobacteria bacterium]
MSLSVNTLLLILGMGLVTFAVRFLPLALLSAHSLNPVVERWLNLVPPAVLAALLAPELLIAREAVPVLNISIDNTLLIAAFPAFLVAWFSKSFFATIITGMFVAGLLRHMGGFA